MTTCELVTRPQTQNFQAHGAEAKMRPLRVLTITPFFPSAENPTLGRFISDPLDYMESLGIWNTSVAVQPFYRASAKPEEGVPAKWIRHFCLPSHLGLPTAGSFLESRVLRIVAEEHLREPFDLVHAHSALPCGHAAMLVSQRLSLPFVVSVHGLDAFFTRQTGRLIGSWSKSVCRDVYRSAKEVICISEKVRQKVLSEVQAKTTVIYNGVDAERFFPSPTPDSSLTVLSVGNLIPSKGNATLLRAFAQIARFVPECRLEVIGDGPENKRLRGLAARLGIMHKVDFKGRQDRACVAAAMRRCSVFALPSDYEGLGCVYLEAMACGKPVIGCHGQGIDEVVKDGSTGILVQPGNEQELADALVTLLRDPGLSERIGSTARRRILQRFTLQQQANQLADLYHRCTA